MYLEYYGLSDFPFQLTPDHRFFFESATHRKAMANLIFGLNQSEGFIVITGEVGAGKTTLLGRLLDELDPDAFVANKIVSTHLQGDDMLRSVASAFAVPYQNLDKVSLLNGIEDFLVACHHQQKRVLLLVDEAQNVTPQGLEELRMLSNFQVANKVPLQSVLLAQPQFRRTLASADLEQFRQRIIASYHLGALTSSETRDYIKHRLSVVGWKDNPSFLDEAFDDIHRLTSGIPRKINTFCTRLMLFCFLDELSVVDRNVVKAVADDLVQEAGQLVPQGRGAGGGVMLSADALGEEIAEGDMPRRLRRLERMVDKHNRALHYLASFAEIAGEGLE